MMSHSITFHSVYFELSTVPKRETIEGVQVLMMSFHSVYFELSTVPKRETIEGVDLYSPLQSFPSVKFDFPEKNRRKSQ